MSKKYEPLLVSDKVRLAYGFEIFRMARHLAGKIEGHDEHCYCRLCGSFLILHGDGSGHVQSPQNPTHPKKLKESSSTEFLSVCFSRLWDDGLQKLSNLEDEFRAQLKVMKTKTELDEMEW